MICERLLRWRQQIGSWGQGFIARVRPQRRYREVRCIIAWAFIGIAVGFLVWAVIIDIEHPPARLPDNTVYYALSMIAQSAAALAGILGAFGLWRLGYLLERDREEEDREHQTRRQLIEVRTRREAARGGKQPPGWMERQLDLRLTGIEVRRQFYRQQESVLKQMLGTVLLVTLTILVLAISGLAFVEDLLGWVWTMRVGIILAGLALWFGPISAIWSVVRQSRLPLLIRREGIHD